MFRISKSSTGYNEFCKDYTRSNPSTSLETLLADIARCARKTSQIGEEPLRTLSIYFADGRGFPWVKVSDAVCSMCQNMENRHKKSYIL
jgi:hypothetical protein